MTEPITRRAFVGLTGGVAGTGRLRGSGPLPGAAGGSEATVSTLWEATYGRGGVTWTGDVVAASDGGYLLACTSAREPDAPDDAWLVKVDEEGAREWDRSYGGEDADKARSVVRGPDGGYAFLGVTYSKGDEDAWLVHVTDAGETTWERTFADRYPRAVLATDDGNFLVAGRTGHGEAPSSDPWLAMIGPDGSERWQAAYPDLAHDGRGDDQHRESEASALATTDDGYVFAGSTVRPEADGWSGWLATVDESGRLTNEHLLPEADHLSAVVPADEDGYVVAGVHRSSGARYNVGWLADVSADGAVEWSRTWDRATPSVLAATDDGYVVAGDWNVPWPIGYFEAWAASVTPDGDERWSERRRKNGGEGFDQVLPTDDGYLFLGHTGPAFPDEEEFAEKEAWLLELTEERGEHGWLPDVFRSGGATGTLATLALAGLGAVAGALVLTWQREQGDGAGEDGSGESEAGDDGR